MNGYQYGEQAGYDGNGMPQDGQQDMLSQQNMMMMGQGMLNGEADSGAAGGQSLDEIVNLNNMSNNLNSKLMRRQSLPQGYQNTTQNQGNNYSNPNVRRMNSMMDFSGSRSPAEAMSSYSYPAGLNSNQGSSMSGNNTPAQNTQIPIQSRRQSGNTELNLSTTFSNTPQNYATMMGGSASYASPAHPSGLDMDISSPFLDPSLGMQMDYSLDQSDMGTNMGSIGGTLGGNMGGNLGQNMSGNMGQDIGNGMSGNMGSHSNNGMNNSMGSNMNANMNNNMGGNMGRSMNANMGQNINQNLNQNIGGNMGNMAGNLGSMGTNGNLSSGMDNNMGSGTDDIPLSMYNQAQFNQNMNTSPMHPGTPQGRPIGPPRVASNTSGTASTQNSKSHRPSMVHQLSRSQSNASFTPTSQHGGNTSSAEAQQPQRPQTHSRQASTVTGFPGQIQNPQPGSTQDRGMGRASDSFDGVNGPLPLQPKQYNPNNQNFPWVPEGGSWPSTMVNKPHMQSAYKNAYSSTGFDMLGVLVCPIYQYVLTSKLIFYTDARSNPTEPRDQHWRG
jgi:hypothetical protein